MTRGRRKDLTIPPSRALLQQRDYRARKAQYVADLEDRVRTAEDENIKLKREIDALRLRASTRGTMGPSAEVVSASSELMHQLTAAASCLARFQQLTFNEQTQQAHAIAQAQLQSQNLLPSSMHDPVRTILPPMHDAISLPPPPQGTSYSPSTPSHSSHSQSRQTTPPRAVLHPSRHSAVASSSSHHHTQQQHHHHPQHPQHHHHSPSPRLPHVHPRRDYRMSPPETPRQGTCPPSSSASTSTSASTSNSSAAAVAITSTTTTSTSATTTTAATSRVRSNSYAVYNEVESAWGYFDSRDLDVDDDGDEEDDEDQLYDEEGHRRPHGPLRRKRSPTEAQRLDGPGVGVGRESAMLSSRRTSDMRSTTSDGSEDMSMRMREDSPMRTR